MNKIDNVELINILDTKNKSNIKIPQCNLDDIELSKTSILNREFIDRIEFEQHSHHNNNNNNNNQQKNNNHQQKNNNHQQQNIKLNKSFDNNIHENNNTSSDATITINDDLILNIIDTPYVEKDSFIYCIISSIIPEFVSENVNNRNKKFISFKQRIAYDLDDKKYYETFNYKKLFKKSEFQQKLLNNEKIFDYSIRKYISDYFHIDILIIYNDLLITTNKTISKNFIILSYYHNKFSLVSSKNGNTIFSSEMFDIIKSKYDLHIDKFLVKSKYKVDCIHKLAIKLNLNIENSDTKRNKKKDDLFDEINIKLSKFT